ncbi:MAG: hypothetical protein VB089_19515 [Anaerolineaceae bacterium]|jgi:cytoskeletal protein RodZ|nr:hypothetical protein [Anaerolineaceae bacterium]
MSDYNDNDNDNLYEGFEEEPAPASESSTGNNRTFLVAVGIIGAIFLLSLIALAVFALVILPQRNQERREQAAQINAANTATSISLTQLAIVQAQQLTPSPTWTSAAGAFPSPTPVIVLPTNTPVPTDTPEPTQELEAAAVGGDLAARTQTVAALLTQAAQAGGGVPGGTQQVTPTALPTAGFADEVGLPGLLGLSVLLVGVIFLVRRLRLSGSG